MRIVALQLEVLIGEIEQRADLGIDFHARQRAGLVLIVVVIFAAVVASHQLTPFAILVAVTALIIFNRCSLRGLPLIMIVLVVAILLFLLSLVP